jgi:CheY-like chemotaxis protein
MAKARILIVEDEAIVAVDIQKTVQTLGYDVPAIAFSGEEALKKTEELHPDVVLMDIVLRGQMDGIEAAQKIYERFGIPSIFMTGYSEKLVEQLTTGKPFLSVIKPVEEEELHTTILKALEAHRGHSFKRVS